jgi:hypothetical protein
VLKYLVLFAAATELICLDTKVLLASTPATQFQVTVAGSPAGQSRGVATQTTSQPASTTLATAKYLGKPVADAWIKANFATFGKNLFRNGDDLVNLVVANYDEGGKLYSPKALFTQSQNVSREPIALNVVPNPVAIKGKICQFQNVKVQSKMVDGYVVSFGQEQFKVLTNEKYLIGETIKLTTFYGMKDPEITFMGPSTWQQIPPEFVEAKPATLDDFTRYINGGNKLILSYKPITIDAAKKLPESDYRLVEKAGKAQYYQANYVPAPIN